MLRGTAIIEISNAIPIAGLSRSLRKPELSGVTPVLGVVVVGPGAGVVFAAGGGVVVVAVAVGGGVVVVVVAVVVGGGVAVVFVAVPATAGGAAAPISAAAAAAASVGLMRLAFRIAITAILIARGPAGAPARAGRLS
jgi:hypothetical protein